MAEDWLADVRKYAPNADEGVVGAIVRYCGIALQSRDSALVAMSDKTERDLVRENYLKKKLGLTNSDAELDEAVIAVGQQMKDDRTKNRVTVYYLLAQHFGSLNIFGGVAGAAGMAAAAAGAFSRDDDRDKGGSAAPIAAAGLGGAAMGAGSASAATPEAAAAPVSMPEPSPAPAAAAPAYAASSYDDDDDASGGGMWGWLKWLLLAAVLLALLFFLLRSCSGDQATPVAEETATEAVPTNDDANVVADDKAADAAAAEELPTPVPAGAGVTAGERNGKPMLTVYFDTGKSDVTNDLATAAARVKDYVASNAGAKLAVSGYNDPTGNAAANAELSKKRAQAVGKALEAAGVPAGSIELVKPEATTDATVDKAAARRVEVTVK
jgi:outer membrane protein OmpA-like peptidoglycan-associated protein